MRQDKTRQHVTRQDNKGTYKTVQEHTNEYNIRQDEMGQSRQDKTSEIKSIQNKHKEYNIRQDNTSQDKARQGKTRQLHTK